MKRSAISSEKRELRNASCSVASGVNSTAYSGCGSLGASSQPLLASGRLSEYGIYGFKSSTGVPSRMSRLCTESVKPSTFSSSTALKPIGFGRYGERVANTPRRSPLRGGDTFGFQLVLRWNQNTTQMKLKLWMSSSACSKLWPENSSMLPATPRAALGWRGASTRSLNGERTTPMGCSVSGERGSGTSTGLERGEHFRGVPLGLHVRENTRDLAAFDHEGGALDAFGAVFFWPPHAELVRHTVPWVRKQREVE